MNKYLVTLNIGGKSLHVKSRESFKHAANRWGCEFVEITDQLQPGVHHYWQKTFVDREFQGRVLQLDADMLISSKAPSPFEIVKEDEFGVVSARQIHHPGIIAGRERALNEWSKRLNQPKIRDEYHLNGGFFLYNTLVDEHQELFKSWRQVGLSTKWCKLFLPEQAALSVMLQTSWKSRIKVHWLSHMWNVVGAQQLSKRHNKYGLIMKGWIYHYTGGEKEKRIQETWWNCDNAIECPAHTKKLLSILPQGVQHGAEIGVLRGHNASGLLWHRPALHMYLVDRWASDEDYMNDGNAGWSPAMWRMIFEECLENLWHCDGRYNILQMPSVTAATTVQNNSLDFVFIDGNHAYEAVKADILAWQAKVKPGGILCGHDYGVKQWGVTQAVQEIFGNKPKINGSVWHVNA